MAVLLSIAQQSYNVGTRQFTPTLGANKREIRATFTRVGWPAGPCLRLTYFYPDGTLAGSVTFDGGNTLDRSGQALSHAGLAGKQDPQTGIRAALPAGQYRVDVEVLQPITTSVTVQDA